MPSPNSLLSIVIVCKNPGPSLARALESVWAQMDSQPEVIVVDGRSSDGTHEWLESHRSRLSTLISEPDTGVYDAMNKGVSSAQGEWLLFLGSDDRLANDDVVKHVIGYAEKMRADVLVGEAVYDDERSYKLASRVNPLARNFIHHQSAIYRRALFAEYGPFDATFSVMGDYEFNVRLWKKRIEFASIPLRVALCGVGGLSDTPRWRGYREEITVRRRHFPVVRCLPWDALSFVRYVRKKIIRSFASTRPDHRPSPPRKFRN